MTEESEDNNGDNPMAGIGKFLRENGAWMLLIFGGIGFMTGGLSLPLIAMLAVGWMVVTASMSSTPPSEERRDNENNREPSRRRDRSSSRQRESDELDLGTAGSLELDAPERNNSQDLVLANQADELDLSQTAIELDVSSNAEISSPMRTPPHQSNDELMLSR